MTEELQAENQENLKWYIVHTYSGYERNVQEALSERIERHGLENRFGQILVPEEEVTSTLKNGSKRSRMKSFLPGYILVQMDLNDHSWRLVKDTPKVTGFLGNKKYPKPIPEEEVKRITKQIKEGSTSVAPKISFMIGETVKVVEGPFVDFQGRIDELNEEKKRVKVLVSIFGRDQIVDLDFSQVQKITE